MIFRYLISALFLLLSYTTQATHIFGGEILYEHVAGLTYKVKLTLYSDCASNSTNSLYTSNPRVDVYNGNNYFALLQLNLVPNSGIEVTPVCPAQAGLTTCNISNSLIPGVKQFKFESLITLNIVSADWKFVFDGQVSANGYAARSNNITNIVNAGNTTMYVEATLNNVLGFNSSPNYTTIPTPFYCTNQMQSYNQGAVDADNDILNYGLSPAHDGSSTQLVTYIIPYNFLNPMGVAPFTFIFNSLTGQMDFTPNIIQRSLIVTKVTEYRNGNIIGTSMREMTVITVPNCNNVPPSGTSVVNSLNVSYANNSFIVCKGISYLSFTINAFDSNMNNVSVLVNGLPLGATLYLVGNNTQNPQININWNIPSNQLPGTYNFFVTLQDDGCPMSSTQTVAYSIVILPQPIVSSINTTVPCLTNLGGTINLSTTIGMSPFTYSINNSAYVNNSQVPQ